MCKKEFEAYFVQESCKTCSSKIKGAECVDFSECSNAYDDFYNAGFNLAKTQYETEIDVLNKPREELKPLEDLYRKENPLLDGKFFIPDTTAFYKWIAQKIQNCEILEDSRNTNSLKETVVQQIIQWCLQHAFNIQSQDGTNYIAVDLEEMRENFDEWLQKDKNQIIKLGSTK